MELQLRLPLRYFSLTRGFPRATGYEILNMIRRAGWLTNRVPVSTLGLRLLTLGGPNRLCQPKTTFLSERRSNIGTGLLGDSVSIENQCGEYKHVFREYSCPGDSPISVGCVPSHD